jgi:hypothetical protein
MTKGKAPREKTMIVVVKEKSRAGEKRERARTTALRPHHVRRHIEFFPFRRRGEEFSELIAAQSAILFSTYPIAIRRPSMP